MNDTRFRRKRLDIKQASNRGWGPISPGAIIIQIRSQNYGLRGQGFKGAFRGKGMVRSLKRVAKKNDMCDVGIKKTNEVQITRRHFVNLVDNEDARSTSKGGFPSAHSPRGRVGKMEEGFPVITEVIVWDCYSKFANVGRISKERSEWLRFAAAGKTGNVTNTNSVSSGEISYAVKFVEKFLVARADKDLTKDSVKLIFKVGRQNLGPANIDVVGVELLEREMERFVPKREQGGLESIIISWGKGMG